MTSGPYIVTLNNGHLLCLGQVNFMEGLMRPNLLRARILLWTEEEIRLNRLPPQSSAILEALLYRGEAAAIVGTGDRQARRVVSALLEQGALTSESTRAPLRLPSPLPSSRAGCRGYFRRGWVNVAIGLLIAKRGEVDRHEAGNGLR